MRSIIQLSADIVLNQNVYFGIRVNGQGKEPFFEIIVLGLPPIKLILVPHFAEAVKSDTLSIDCVFFEHFIKYILIKDLVANFKK